MPEHRLSENLYYFTLYIIYSVARIPLLCILYLLVTNIIYSEVVSSGSISLCNALFGPTAAAAEIFQYYILQCSMQCANRQKAEPIYSTVIFK